MQFPCNLRLLQCLHNVECQRQPNFKFTCIVCVSTWLCGNCKISLLFKCAKITTILSLQHSLKPYHLKFANIFFISIHIQNIHSQQLAFYTALSTYTHTSCLNQLGLNHTTNLQSVFLRHRQRSLETIKKLSEGCSENY